MEMELEKPSKSIFPIFKYLSLLNLILKISLK